MAENPDYEKFVAKTVREAERKLQVPAGWWGTWRRVRGPNGAEVVFTGKCWVLRHKGALVSKHDSRSFAIAKGRKL